MARQNCCTRRTFRFHLPAISSYLCDPPSKLTTFLPPLSNVLETSHPHWQWMAMSGGEEGSKRVLAGNSSLWMKIEHVKTLQIVDTLHYFAPYISNLYWICHTQAIEEHFIIWNTGWHT